MRPEKTRVRVVQVSAGNIAQHPRAVCFINPSHEHHHLKVDWLKEQFKKGLRVKLLYLRGQKNPVGFIEYVPGEHCWRPVVAAGYMFIHCLWTHGLKHQRRGLGRLLLREAEKDAKNMLGVAVLTSDGSFMAKKDIFLKNGYALVSEAEGEQLLAKQFKRGPRPSLIIPRRAAAKNRGLSIVYSRQCPWVSRFMEEVKPILKEKKLKPVITELKTATMAQRAPSHYGVFNLIYKGRLLADRYISTTRFLNILEKEVGARAPSRSSAGRRCASRPAGGRSPRRPRG